jgi:hypothetical protein
MGDQSVLAIRAGVPTDRRVYELHLQDAWDDSYDHGNLPADYGYPVFDDYLDLIAAIHAIRLPGGNAGTTIRAAS